MWPVSVEGLFQCCFVLFFQALSANNIPCEVVTGGGTGTYMFEATSGGEEMKINSLVTSVIIVNVLFSTSDQRYAVQYGEFEIW